MQEENLEEDVKKDVDLEPSKKEENKNTKNFITAVIVIGVILVVGIVYKAQNYMKYRSYERQAKQLQKQAEEYQIIALKKLNDAQKKNIGTTKKQSEKLNK